MSVFDDALATLVNDANLGVDVTYTPAAGGGIGEFSIGVSAIGGSGTPITCRGMFTHPDVEPVLGANLRITDRKRGLMLRAADVPAPARGDTVTIGASSYRVLDVSARDPQRLSWHLQLAAN